MKHQQVVTYLITLVFTMLFSCANPASSPSAEYNVTLSGTLVNLVGTQLDSVHIVLWIPFSKDTAKSNGTFSISFQASDKTAISDSITFSRSGFLSTTKYFSYSSSSNTFNFSAIVLKGVTSAQDSLTAGRPSLRAGEIVYAGSSVPSLSIYGAGGTDEATLTFQVEDSLGNPIDSTNQTLVHFRFANTPPDTFTQLSRSSVKTNSNGIATVLLGSGLRAGIASVQAYAAVKHATDTTEVDTITSSVVSIPIFGGFPDSAHFSMSAAKVNIPGAVQAGIQTPITALIGDKYGNPAQPGTIVYFTTTGGIVSPASASSADDGSASVSLVSGNPIPAGGIVTVTAELTTGAGGVAGQTPPQGVAVGNAKNLFNAQLAHVNHAVKKVKRLSKVEQTFENKRTVVKFVQETNKSVQNIPQSHKTVIGGEIVAVGSLKGNQKTSQSRPATSAGGVTASAANAGVFYSSVSVIFSGNALITVPDTTLNVFVGGQQQVNFTVADKYGNPLSGGSEIKVTTSGSGASDITLTGDVDKILPDTKDKSFTVFTVYAKDTNAVGPSRTENFSLSIVVTSPNGNVGRTLSGTLFANNVTDTANVAQVVLQGPSIDSLTVTGGGGVSSEVIQFQVLNVSNKPAQNVPVQFSIVQSVGGGEYFNPTVATSDVNGKVQTTLFAGIRSGLVQIVAKAKKDTLPVVSNPKTVYIRTGIISSIAIINVSSSTLSVQGVGGNETSTITYEGRDSLGNPVDASNSASVKFTLQGDTSSRVSPLVAKTDPVTGMVTTSFTSGIKSGLAYVTASARGDSITSSPVQFTISGGFPDSTHFSIGPEKLNIAGAAIYGLTDNINLVVGDKYGNPAQPGSVVFFNTTGGIIQASSPTTAAGTATAVLTTGNPIPSNGLALITAQVGASSSANKMGTGSKVIPLGKRAFNKASVSNSATLVPSFTRSTMVLFSGRPRISTSNNNFIVPVGSSAQIIYTVADSLGNPLVAGTTITVTLSGSGSSDVAMTGDVSVNLPDTQDKRYTLFQVTLKDIRTTGLNLSQALILTIDVNGQNGINKLILSGNLSGTGGIAVDSSIVSRIVLVNPSSDTILVSGYGGVNTDTIKFKVYNTFGLPAKNVPVTFKMPLSLGGGEYLSPTNASTDTGGNVKTTLISGTKFGEVLVTASTTKDSLTLTSDPKVIYIVIPPSTRLASQVQYLGATATDIFVDGVGGLENSTISYQVTDSLGIPIDRQRRVGVTYYVQFFPNSSIAGGTPPSVIPSTDSTDDSGQLHTSVVSGTEAGVVQLVANINVPGRPTLVSQPVKITVHAGFADQAHFTLIPSAYGVAGLDNSFAFSVVVGDTFSNPVAKGTAVYFHSQAGVIQTGESDFSAYTDISGQAQVHLLLVNPKPDPGTPYEYKPGIASGLRFADATHIDGRDGYFWVYAQTQGHNATNVTDSALLVWSVGLITVTGLPASVTVSNVTNTSPPISITIKDGNGNPLPTGTTVTASIEPIASPPTGFQVGVSGGISSNFFSTIPYSQNSIFPGAGITDFTFNVVNESVPSTVATGVTVTVVITISAPNFGTANYSFTATMQ